MVNYVILAAVAERLIDKNGADVTLRKQSRALDEPSKPWRGTDATDTTTTVKGVVLGFRKKDIDGEIVRRGDRQALVAFNTAGSGIETYDELEDVDSNIWRIVDVEFVKPASIGLLYKLQLRA